MENQVLQVQNLNVSFTDNGQTLWGKKKKIHVLKDVTFHMQEHEILGLVGESGCGKSTLAKTILHLNQNYTGEIISPTEYPQMIFQDPYSSLNPAKTVKFLLMEPLKLRTKLSLGEMEDKVLCMLKKVGLSPEIATRYPKELSGGQRQRVCIAQALMLEPKLLIADEPVSALDVTIQAQIMDLLMALHKEMGLSILFISHDLRIVYQICDRVMIMQNGRIIEEGDTDTIYENPKEEYTKSLLKSAGISL